jgi:hypothetical protein
VDGRVTLPSKGLRNKWRKLPACDATIYRKLEAYATETDRIRNFILRGQEVSQTATSVRMKDNSYPTRAASKVHVYL